LESSLPDDMLTPIWGGSATARRTRETKTAASSGTPMVLGRVLRAERNP